MTKFENWKPMSASAFVSTKPLYCDFMYAVSRVCVCYIPDLEFEKDIYFFLKFKHFLIRACAIVTEHRNLSGDHIEEYRQK